jgi:hypothetical protein
MVPVALDLPEDPEALGDEIARTAARIDASTHRLLACIRAFDESEEWGKQGALSCAHWLTWRINLDPVTARERVRVARALGRLPQIDDALRKGELSYAKARAITRIATAENEATLLNMALCSTGAQLERLVRKVRWVGTLDEKTGERLDDRRYVHEESMENGMIRITAVLHPDEAALVMKALERARTPPPAPPPSRQEVSADSAETPSPPARPARKPLADALVDVAESYLAHGEAKGNGGERTQIFVHLDQDPLAPDGTMAATLDDGTRVSAEAFRRLACDAGLVECKQSPTGNILDLGRRARTVNAALRRALWIRDRGCAFPGCTHTRYVHAHHIVHWLQGGKTSLENLVSLCSRHHRLLHEGGFSIERREDGAIQFRNARGEAIDQVIVAKSIGSCPAVSAEDLSAPTYFDQVDVPPTWDGTPMDYELAVHLILDDDSAAKQVDERARWAVENRARAEARRTPVAATWWWNREPDLID